MFCLPHLRFCLRSAIRLVARLRLAFPRAQVKTPRMVLSLCHVMMSEQLRSRLEVLQSGRMRAFFGREGLHNQNALHNGDGVMVMSRAAHLVC